MCHTTTKTVKDQILKPNVLVDFLTQTTLLFYLNVNKYKVQLL